MPHQNGSNCSQRRDYQWDRAKSVRENDYSFARNRVRDIPPSAHRGYEFATRQLKRRKLEKRALISDFQAHVERWKAETMHLSSIPRRILHQSYLHIISMGYSALPLLLAELRDRPDHWLVALNAITTEDPAEENATFSEAVGAWLKWGRDRGLC
jgi:hypothetical protein